MYKSYYGLNTDPFRLTPDPKFVYAHSSYRKAQAYMQHTLEQGDGFLVITGGSGTGKTTLVEDYLGTLKPGNMAIATLVTTRLEVDDLLRLIAYAFGINAKGLDKATLLRELERFLKLKPRALLIIDEAQNLSEAALEEIRMLTNLHAGSRPLLQVFLLGQQELCSSLHRPKMEQLHQRVMAACDLEPLSLDETREYILHRLRCAGWGGHPALGVETFILIHRFSGGLPRYISKLCARLFLHGAVERRGCLGITDILTVIQEIGEEELLPLNLLPEPESGVPLPGMQDLLRSMDLPPEWMLSMTAEEQSFLDSQPAITTSQVWKAAAIPPTAKPVPEAAPAAAPGPDSTAEAGDPRKAEQEDVQLGDLLVERVSHSRLVPKSWRHRNRIGAKAKMLGYSMAASLLLLTVYRLGTLNVGHEQASTGQPLAGARSAAMADGNLNLIQSRDPHQPELAQTSATGPQQLSADMPGPTGADDSESAALDQARRDAPDAGPGLDDMQSGAGTTAAAVPEREVEALVSVPAVSLDDRLQHEDAGQAETGKGSETDLGGHATSVQAAASINTTAIVFPGMPPTQGEVVTMSGDTPDRGPAAVPAVALVKTGHPLPETDGEGEAIPAAAQRDEPASVQVSGDEAMQWRIDVEAGLAQATLADSDAELAGNGQPAQLDPLELPQIEMVEGGSMATTASQVSGVVVPAGVAPIAVAVVEETAEASVQTDAGEEIADLLQLAEQALNRDRLRYPAQGNAWHYYQEALSLDPGNADALAGVQRISGRYANLARNQLDLEQYEKASVFVKRGLSVIADDPALLALEEDLRAHQAAEAAAMQAREARILAEAAGVAEGAETDSGGGSALSQLKAFFSSEAGKNQEQLFQDFNR